MIKPGLTTERFFSSMALASALALFCTACSTKVMKAENSQEILKNSEFESAVKVESFGADPGALITGTYVRLPGPEPVPGAFPPAPEKKSKKKSSKIAKGPVGAVPPPAVPANSTVHEPSIEDGEGFVARRPLKDPYRVGERVTLEVSYFGVVAGEMTMETQPFVEVNGRRSYKFVGTANTSSVFEMVYAVEDWFEAYLDYDTLMPSHYALHVKESKQLRETRSVFDWKRLVATWWDKKIDNEQKVEEKKKEWEIPNYSQNIFTAAYYLRNFTLRPGKKIAFHVAHEGENLLVTAEVVRRERISTPAGELETLVVKPHVELNGVFKPVGDIFLWLTDDDRKLIVRIESKIKIGTIVGAVKKIERGQP